MINNYSPAPKWEWLEVDIYRAVKKRRGKYPSVATDTGVNSSFSYYSPPSNTYELILDIEFV